MPDLYVVFDTRGTDEGVVVWADTPADAAVAANPNIPTPYVFSDGVAPPRRLAVHRAEKVGEFEIRAEEVDNG